MKLINQHYQALDSSDDFLFFEYNIKEEDMFLVKKIFWYDSEPVLWYTLMVGRRSIELPGHMYVMVADIASESVDWVRVDELMGRDFSTYTYKSELTPEKWSMEEMKVVMVDPEERSCRLPFSSNILPVMLGKDRAILISEKDCYKKTKNIAFPYFL